MNEGKDQKKSTKKLGIILVFVFIIVIVLFYMWIGGAFKSPKKTVSIKKQTSIKKPESIEYKLAVINAESYVPKDHITVARFRSLLKQLSNTYIENRQQIADMTVKAQEILRKDEGIKESLLNMMEGMNKIFPMKIENQKYSEYMAAYMGLRRKGQSHSEAINGLKSIIEALTNKL